MHLHVILYSNIIWGTLNDFGFSVALALSKNYSVLGLAHQNKRINNLHWS